MRVLPVGVGRLLRCADDSLAAADRAVDGLAAESESFAEQPGIGHPHPFRRELRLFHVGEYLILDREVPEGIEALRHLQGRRDLTRIVR